MQPPAVSHACAPRVAQEAQRLPHKRRKPARRAGFPWQLLRGSDSRAVPRAGGGVGGEGGVSTTITAKVLSATKSVRTQPPKQPQQVALARTLARASAFLRRSKDDEERPSRRMPSTEWAWLPRP